MASSLSRDDHFVGTLDRQPAKRMSTRGYRPASKRDAALLGTTSFYGDSVYDVAGKFLGEIQELVIDIDSGRVAICSYGRSGGFWGWVENCSPFPGAW